MAPEAAAAVASIGTERGSETFRDRNKTNR